MGLPHSSSVNPETNCLTIRNLPLPDSLYAAENEELVSTAFGYCCNAIRLVAKSSSKAVSSLRRVSLLARLCRCRPARVAAAPCRCRRGAAAAASSMSPVCALIGLQPQARPTARYLNVTLRYPIVHLSSKSLVTDPVRSPGLVPAEYPCYTRGADPKRTLVAMEYLKRNMEMLLASHGLRYAEALKSQKSPHLLLYLQITLSPPMRTDRPTSRASQANALPMPPNLATPQLSFHATVLWSL